MVGSGWIVLHQLDDCDSRNAWDYDSWAAQGLPSWSYENLRPYLRKIEDATLVTRERDQDRGYSGPIRLSYGTLQHPISKAFIESAVSAGLPENNGFNGPSQVGTGFYELTIAEGKRSGAFKYLDRAKGRSNLTLMTNCRVRRIAMEGTRARGVGHRERRMRDNHLGRARGTADIRSHRLTATADAVGDRARGSPAIAWHRRLSSIPLASDRNLQDHLDCAIRLEASQPVTLTPYLGLIKGGLAGAQYILRGHGSRNVARRRSRRLLGAR